MGDILTSSYYDLLDDETQSRDDVDQRVELAEYKVVGRYREGREGSLQWYWEGALDPTQNVHLWGWEEDSSGDFDASASDDELVRRLRLVIAAVTDWSLEYEQRAQLGSEGVGARSVSYADAPTIPSRLFRPLAPYDETEPFCGF